MPLDFPNSPSTNDTYSAGGITWKYDGTVWNVVGTTSRPTIPTQDSAPSNPSVGDAWVDSDTGNLFIYYDGFWVTPNVPMAPVSPSYTATLPPSPTDGQEIYYAADGTNSIIWHLRYRSAANGASAGSGAWEFLGGPALNPGRSGSLSSTTSAGAGIELTNGPVVSLPRGRFLIQYGAEVGLPGAGGSADFSLLLKNGSTQVNFLYTIFIDQYERQAASTEQRLEFTAAATLKLFFRNNQGRNCSVDNGFISAIPIRIW